MLEVIRIDSGPKFFSILAALISLIMIVYGLYGESYWSAFGLVLLMPSLLLMAILSSPPSMTN